MKRKGGASLKIDDFLPDFAKTKRRGQTEAEFKAAMLAATRNQTKWQNPATSEASTPN